MLKKIPTIQESCNHHGALALFYRTGYLRAASVRGQTISNALDWTFIGHHDSALSSQARFDVLPAAELPPTDAAAQGSSAARFPLGDGMCERVRVVVDLPHA